MIFIVASLSSGKTASASAGQPAATTRLASSTAERGTRGDGLTMMVLPPTDGRGDLVGGDQHRPVEGGDAEHRPDRLGTDQARRVLAAQGRIKINRGMDALARHGGGQAEHLDGPLQLQHHIAPGQAAGFLRHRIDDGVGIGFQSQHHLVEDRRALVGG